MNSELSRRQVLRGLGLSVGAGTLAAPRRARAQAAGAKPVTLTYVNYSAGVDKPMWDTLVAEFNKIIPGESWGDDFLPAAIGE